MIVRMSQQTSDRSYAHINELIKNQANEIIDKQTSRQTNKQADKQTNKQTNR